MKRALQITADGSPTIYSDEFNATYHSKHGAIQESMHVFINAGLEFYIDKTNANKVSIFEMGFGTGLNALLVAQYANDKQINISYDSVELYPLSHDELSPVKYEIKEELLFSTIHDAAWNEESIIHEKFILKKLQANLLVLKIDRQYDIVFYDAFAPTAQPELWTGEVFSKLYHHMIEGGVLVTYCSKSIVRKTLIASGFQVQKIQGPPGKREMLRAVK